MFVEAGSGIGGGSADDERKVTCKMIDAARYWWQAIFRGDFVDSGSGAEQSGRALTFPPEKSIAGWMEITLQDGSERQVKNARSEAGG